MKLTTTAMIAGVLLSAAPTAMACSDRGPFRPGRTCGTVVVTAGHYAMQPRTVTTPGRWVYETQNVTTPGRWDVTYQNVCVQNATYRTVNKRVLVRNGYWKRVDHCGSCRPSARIRIRPFKRVKFDINTGCHSRHKVWVPPVYETRCERVLVPARYERRAVRNWIEPCTTQKRVRVWKPACSTTQQVRVWVPPVTARACERPGYNRHNRHHSTRQPRRQRPAHLRGLRLSADAAQYETPAPRRVETQPAPRRTRSVEVTTPGHQLRIDRRGRNKVVQVSGPGGRVKVAKRGRNRTVSVDLLR